MTDYRLDTNGPHSGDYTRHVADALAESVRVLNHHTRDADALPDPAVIYDLLGSLFTATVGVDQLLRQVEERLGAMADSGRLRDDSGDHSRTPNQRRMALADARRLAEALAVRLERVHQITSGLYLQQDGGR